MLDETLLPPESMRGCRWSWLLLRDIWMQPMDKARREYGRRIDTVGIIGTPDAVIRWIEEEASRGVSLFVFTFADGATPQSLELFAREVAPAFS